jgi:hypothetical protein
MSDKEPERDDKLEHFAKRTFEQGTAGLGAAARSRLTQARARAVAEVSPRRPLRRPLGSDLPWGRFALAAAGTVAAVAVALSFMLGYSGSDPTGRAPVAALDDLELLTGGDELDLLEQELEFYAWLEQQPELAPAADDRGQNGDDGGADEEG